MVSDIPEKIVDGCLSKVIADDVVEISRKCQTEIVKSSPVIPFAGASKIPLECGS